MCGWGYTYCACGETKGKNWKEVFGLNFVFSVFPFLSCFFYLFYFPAAQQTRYIKVKIYFTPDSAPGCNLTDWSPWTSCTCSGQQVRPPPKTKQNKVIKNNDDDDDEDEQKESKKITDESNDLANKK